MPSEDPASATTATDTAMTADASSGASEPEGANGTTPASDTVPTDTVQTDAGQTDTVPTDTVQTDAGQTDTVQTDTVQTDAASVDETSVDETATGQTATDETATEPEVPIEPAVDEEPAMPAHLWAVVMVFDIAVDLPTPHARVTLREVADPYRMLVIPIGLPEGTALAHAWRGVPTPRPLTHELFSDVLTRLGATIDVVRLTGRRAGVVLAEIEISSPRGREVVSCRPTDGVTLSVRQGVPAPILVDLRLFDDDGDVDPDG
jgi:hypothetical protein